METPKLNLWQRFRSETPPFWKKVQAMGGSLVIAGTSLLHAPAIPAIISTTLITAGTIMAAVSQFAVKQTEPITTQTNNDTK